MASYSHLATSVPSSPLSEKPPLQSSSCSQKTDSAANCVGFCTIAFCAAPSLAKESQGRPTRTSTMPCEKNKSPTRHSLCSTAPASPSARGYRPAPAAAHSKADDSVPRRSPADAPSPQTQSCLLALISLAPRPHAESRSKTHI